MPYARTPEAVQEQRLKASIRPPRRYADGRTRKPTTREARQQARADRDRESMEQILSTALSQPHRRNLPNALKRDDGTREEISNRDHRAGYALGRLRLQGIISNDQLIAGNRYTELALRYGHHIVGHLPKFPSQAINDTVKGLACSADMTDDEAFNLRRSWSDVQSALSDTCEPQACNSALGSICVMDRDPRSEREVGALRIALNALHNLWR